VSAWRAPGSVDAAPSGGLTIAATGRVTRSVATRSIGSSSSGSCCWSTSGEIDEPSGARPEAIRPRNASSRPRPVAGTPLVAGAVVAGAVVAGAAGDGAASPRPGRAGAPGVRRRVWRVAGTRSSVHVGRVHAGSGTSTSGVASVRHQPAGGRKRGDVSESGVTFGRVWRLRPIA
jgi:hypothetical protein